MMGTSGDQRSTDARKRRISIETIPSWLQGIAAITGVLLTAVGVFVIGGPRSETTVPPSQVSATTSPPQAVVTLESVTTSTAEVRGTGSFQRIDPASDAVLFIGQPKADPAADWLPVVASITPTTTESDGRLSGRWEAVRPSTEHGIPYTWYVVIAPKAGGAEDPYADLRENGPSSELVEAVSEPFTTSG